MSRLEALINELCPDGVEYVNIGSVVNYEQPSKYIVRSTDYSDDFLTPVLTAGQSFILGYTNEKDNLYSASKENPVIIFDDFTGAFKWVDFLFKVKSSAMKMLTANADNITLRYIYHTMGNIGYSSVDHKRLWISMYSEIKIPLPPLSVQKEIVRILDNFTELTAELTAELTTRKKQYEYYRNELLTKDGWDITPLGEVCTLITKGTTPKKYTPNGIRFIKTESFVSNFINNAKTMFISEATHNGELKRSILHEKDILFTIAGATIGKCASVEKMNLPANTNQALAIIRLNQEVVNQRFIFHVLQSQRMSDYIKIKVKGSAQPNLNLQQMNEFLVPVPSLEEQERIVAILDRFDILCNDLTSGLPAEIEARRKQYEHYRDKLLTFKEIVK